MLAVFLHERLAGSQIVWIRARRYTNVCRSFRAGRLFISVPGFHFAPPWAEVSYAFGVPPENAPIAELFLWQTDTRPGARPTISRALEVVA